MALKLLSDGREDAGVFRNGNRIPMVWLRREKVSPAREVGPKPGKAASNEFSCVSGGPDCGGKRAPDLVAKSPGKNGCPLF